MKRLELHKFLLLLSVVLATSGCITCGNNALTVGQMQPQWHGCPRSDLRPIDLTMLQRDVSNTHILAPRDVIGIYVEGVVSGAEISSGGREMPTVAYPPTFGEAAGTTPVVGQPMEVAANGTVQLPQLTPIDVSGLTIQQLADKIRNAYVAEELLQENEATAFVQVWLIRPRTNRILVIREDAPVTNPAITRRDTRVIARKGSGDVVNLAERDSDLLNALVATGGLPGEDARSEVWILRGRMNWDVAQGQLQAGTSIRELSASCPQSGKRTAVPLRVRCGQPIPFTREDVVLEDGDIVFVEKRHEEYFYTGGLLSSGQIPLPRDEDVDILEAIALSNIGVGGPAGVNASASQFRSGPGNVIPPTRALVIRKLPGGQQVKIDVDLRRAVNDAEERIRIQPEDFVMLQYRAHELFGNIALNFVNFSYIIPND